MRTTKRKYTGIAFLGIIMLMLSWSPSKASAAEGMEALRARVSKITSRLEPVTGLKPRVQVSPDITNSAFVLPDGTIVISSGLVSTAETDDEIAFILAHEISHIVAKDYNGRFSPALASFPGLPNFQLSEINADVNAVLYMKKAGFSPEASIDLLKRISPDNPNIKGRLETLVNLLLTLKK